MKCPPFGLCVPVIYERARDVDTIEVSLLASGLVWAIRLVGVWGPELHRGPQDSQKLAREGKEWIELFLRSQSDLRLHIELPHTPNVLKSLTFDRVPGVLYVGPGEMTVNKMIVNRGYASSTKGGRLGE